MNELIASIMTVLSDGLEYSLNELVIFTDGKESLVLNALNTIMSQRRIVVNDYGETRRYKLVNIKESTDTLLPSSTLKCVRALLMKKGSVTALDLIDKYNVDINMANLLIKHTGIKYMDTQRMNTLVMKDEF